MKSIVDIRDFPQTSDFVAVALGNFDGVHRGHQIIINKLVEKSQIEKGISVIFTFDPHPLKVLKQGDFPKLLSTLEEKKRLVKRLEVDYFVSFPFDQHVARMAPADFIEDILLKRLRAKHLFVGYNFTFGKKGEGNTDLLTTICNENGCEVTVIPEVKHKYTTVSSTKIREYLDLGKIKEANAILGYTYTFSGEVGYGDQRGRQMGFPTANLLVHPYTMIPGGGVYAVKVLTENGMLNGVCNIGYRPTFGCNLPKTIEIHLIDCYLDLYGKELRIFFVEQVRKEKKFSGMDELMNQIKLDVLRANKVLNKVDNVIY